MTEERELCPGSGRRGHRVYDRVVCSYCHRSYGWVWGAHTPEHEASIPEHSKPRRKKKAQS